MIQGAPLQACRAGRIPETRLGAVSTMFVWRILWPLRWFGLLEYRGPAETRDVAWRKSVLFDRFLSLNVRLSDNRRSRL